MHVYTVNSNHTVSTVTTFASACLYCYHTGKYMSVVSTVTTLARICQCYKYNSLASICLIVTIPAIICLNCYHTGKYISVVLPHWQVSVLIDATLASICKHCYHIGKCLSVSLPHWQVSAFTVTTLVNICLYCYHPVFAICSALFLTTCLNKRPIQAYIL